MSAPVARPPRPGASLVAWSRRWLPRLLGLALFGWALAAVGPASIWRALQTANPWLVLPAALAAVPFIYVKGWRWSRILAGLDVALPLGTAFELYGIGIWAGQVTPGQAGDFLKAWYLRSRGVELARALLSSFLDRLFDLGAVFALGAVGLFALVGGGRSLLVTLAALLAVVGVLAGAMTARWRAPLLAALARVTPARLRARLAADARLRSLADTRLDAAHLAPVLGLTALSWILSLARVYLCFRAVGVLLPLVDFLVVAAVITLAGLITIGGIGTRDAAMLALLGPYGYDGGRVLAVSFLILVLNLSNIVPGFLVWLREPVPLRSVTTDEEGAR